MNNRALIESFGSPLYVYQLATVREAHAALVGSLPQDALLYYSFKANPHPQLCGQLRACGCRAEVSSERELTTALAAGFAADQVLYNGPGKSVPELHRALRHGVRDFSVDSVPQYLRLSELARGLGVRARVLLRINPDVSAAGVGLAMTGTASQFGLDVKQARLERDSLTENDGAKLVGFHCYMGTNLLSVEALMSSFVAAVDACRELATCFGFEPEIIDLGGGFGHAYASAGDRLDFSALREPLTELVSSRFPAIAAGKTRVAFESGRYLVAGCGALVCTVEDVKLSKGKRFVLLDTGIHHLGGMSGLRRVPSVGAQLEGETLPGAELEMSDLVGPLCSPLDYLARGARLPAVQSGDVLAIPNVGAYGLTASLLGFLSRDCAAEVVLNGDRVVEASRLSLVREFLKAMPS